jgi:hypothetical protein
MQFSNSWTGAMKSFFVPWESDAGAYTGGLLEINKEM